MTSVASLTCSSPSTVPSSFHGRRFLSRFPSCNLFMFAHSAGGAHLRALSFVQSYILSLLPVVAVFVPSAIAAGHSKQTSNPDEPIWCKHS